MPPRPNTPFLEEGIFSGEMRNIQNTVKGTNSAKQNLSSKPSLTSKEIEVGISEQWPGNNLRSKVEGISEPRQRPAVGF